MKNKYIVLLDDADESIRIDVEAYNSIEARSRLQRYIPFADFRLIMADRIKKGTLPMISYKFFYFEDGKPGLRMVCATDYMQARRTFDDQHPNASGVCLIEMSEEEERTFPMTYDEKSLRLQVQQAHDEYLQARLVAARATLAYQETFRVKEHSQMLADLALQKLEAVQERYINSLVTKGGE